MYVRASAYVCLGSLVAGLGPKAIAYLPRFVPAMLNTMQGIMASKGMG
jgi:hypothetical protein